jgi:hypothetical protein
VLIGVAAVIFQRLGQQRFGFGGLAVTQGRQCGGDQEPVPIIVPTGREFQCLKPGDRRQFQQLGFGMRLEEISFGSAAVGNQILRMRSHVQQFPAKALALVGLAQLEVNRGQMLGLIRSSRIGGDRPSKRGQPRR